MNDSSCIFRSPKEIVVIAIRNIAKAFETLYKITPDEERPADNALVDGNLPRGIEFVGDRLRPDHLDAAMQQFNIQMLFEILNCCMAASR